MLEWVGKFHARGVGLEPGRGEIKDKLRLHRKKKGGKKLQPQPLEKETEKRWRKIQWQCGSPQDLKGIWPGQQLQPEKRGGKWE